MKTNEKRLNTHLHFCLGLSTDSTTVSFVIVEFSYCQTLYS